MNPGRGETAYSDLGVVKELVRAGQQQRWLVVNAQCLSAVQAEGMSAAGCCGSGDSRNGRGHASRLVWGSPPVLQWRGTHMPLLHAMPACAAACHEQCSQAAGQGGATCLGWVAGRLAAYTLWNMDRNCCDLLIIACGPRLGCPHLTPDVPACLRPWLSSVSDADEEKKWLDWPEYLQVCAELRLECAARDPNGRHRKPSAVAWSLQRYLVFSILSCVPDRQARTVRCLHTTVFSLCKVCGSCTAPPPLFSLHPSPALVPSCLQRTLRELEVGRTLVRDREGRWVIRHGPQDYKVRWAARPWLSLPARRPALPCCRQSWLPASKAVLALCSALLSAPAQTGRAYGERPPLAIAPHIYPELEAYMDKWRACLEPRHNFLFTQ